MTSTSGLGVSGLGGVVPRQLRARAGQPGFALPDLACDEKVHAGQTAGVALVTLLGLQETEPALAPLTADAAARERGQALLGGLGEFQRALLGGGSAASARTRLQTLLRATGAADDPALAGIVRAIELRAAVEAARPGGTIL